MFHLTAVRIEDAIAEIGLCFGGGLDQQDLVGTNPEVAISQGAGSFRCQFDVLRHTIQHDKVIARAVHFAETPKRGSGLECGGAVHDGA